MRPAEWNVVSRILVVRLDNIGDVIMLGPSLRTLKNALPQASITLLASPAGSQAAPLLPWVDEVIIHRATWQQLPASQVTRPSISQTGRSLLAGDPSYMPAAKTTKSSKTSIGRSLLAGDPSTMPPALTHELALADKLAARRFDAACIFTSFTQSPWPPAYLCHLAGIPLRLGQSLEFGGSLLSTCVKPPPLDGHQVDRNLHLLEEAGFTVTGRDLELRVPASALARADALLRELGIDPTAPFLALAPGASCPSRRYDAGRFAQTLRRLRESSGLPAVVLGAPRERELCATVAAVGGAPSLAGRTTVAELAGIIARARLLLANDSGPMHLADALDCAMVILFSGSEYESQWRPRRAPAVLLRRPTRCSPCFDFTCPHGMECLDIPADEVAAKALAMLNLQEPRKGPLDHATT